MIADMYMKISVKIGKYLSSEFLCVAEVLMMNYWIRSILRHSVDITQQRMMGIENTRCI